MLRDVDGMTAIPSGEHCLPGIWAVREGGKASELANQLEGLLPYYQRCPGKQCEIKLKPMLGQEGHATEGWRRQNGARDQKQGGDLQATQG